MMWIMRVGNVVVVDDSMMEGVVVSLRFGGSQVIIVTIRMDHGEVILSS
jgi:hypothetical protein